MIRQAQLADAKQLASIHKNVLPKDLLPRLGSSFLEKNYYSSILEFDDINTLVYEINGVICSFVSFAQNATVMQHWIEKQKLSIILTLTKQCVMDPGLLLLFFSFFLRKTEPMSLVKKLNSFPELTFIATLPEHQGHGYGAKLVHKGLKQLKQLKMPGCFVKTSSDQAENFYLRLGFKNIGKEKRGRNSFCILYYLL